MTCQNLKLNIFSYLNKQAKSISSHYQEEIDNLASDILNEIIDYTDDIDNCKTILNQLEGMIIGKKDTLEEIYQKAQYALSKAFGEEIGYIIQDKINSFLSE